MVKVQLKILILFSILIAIILMTLPSGSSESNKIIWLDFEEGSVKAHDENKIILIDFYTDWCTWCTEMDENTYSKSDIIEKSEQFVCVKVDGDVRTDLTQKYNINGYPTTLFLSANGTEVHRVVGYAGPDEFMNHMRFALGENEKPPEGGSDSIESPCGPAIILVIGLILISIKAFLRK
jgi:thiol:disulfide interchange protein